MEKSYFKHRIALLYGLISFIIFNSIYETSKSVVDELFHVEQGLNYCYSFFHEWNPKITTFPGLYLLAQLVPRCSLYNLRMISLISSVINFYLIFAIRSIIVQPKYDQGRLKVLIDTMSLSALPPLYFFSFVYYTDVPSLTFIMLTIYFAMKEKFFTSSIFGLFSVLMRQTNIVWVAGILGSHLVDDMILAVHPKVNSGTTKFSHFWTALKHYFSAPKLIVEFIGESVKKYFGFMLVILGFIAFLIINGSIVVGDKTAHEATIHLPQLLYFSLFILIFGFSMWITQVWSFIKQLRSMNFIAVLICTTILMAVIIRFNTIVHPYLLADNRHYTFYVWNRLYSRNEYMRFLLIPVYIFGMYVIGQSLHGSIGIKLFYIISTALTICLQSLVEVRYFLIPYIVMRLFRRDVGKKWTFVEFLINLTLNYVTIRIFHDIKIQWSDFEEPQRIIW